MKIYFNDRKFNNWKNNSLFFTFFIFIILTGLHFEVQFGGFNFFGKEMRFSTIELTIMFFSPVLFIINIQNRNNIEISNFDIIFLFSFIAYLISLIVSTIYASNKIEAIKYDIRIFSVIFFCAMFLRLINQKNYEFKVNNILQILGLIACIIGFFEHFNLYNIKDFMISHYWGIGSREYAVTSTFIHNNIFGNYIVLLLFIAMGNWDKCKTKFQKSIIIVSIPFYFVNLVLSLSRSAWLSFGVASILLMINPKRWKKHTLIVLFLFAVFLTTLLNYQLSKNRIEINVKNINYDKINTAMSLRLELWNAAFFMFKDHPITGVGLNNYRSVFKDYRKYAKKWPYKVTDTANNQYLTVLAEQGVLGVIPFFAMIILILYMALFNLLRGGNEFYASGVIAYFVSAIFDYMWMEYTYLFIFVLLIGYNYIEFYKNRKSKLAHN